MQAKLQFELANSIYPLNQAAADLILAVGTSHFEHSLFNAATAAAGIDHFMILALIPEGAPRCVASFGRMGERPAAALIRRYEGEFFRLDLNLTPMTIQTPDGPLIWFEDFGDAPHPPRHLQPLRDDAGFSDQYGLGFRRGGRAYFTNFYLADGEQLSGAQKVALRWIGPVLAAAIVKHFSPRLRTKKDDANLLEEAINGCPALAIASEREKAVCHGIVIGRTSEGIGLKLNISRNTVLTYRKRLYEKLGISSQNELFMLLMKSMLRSGQNRDCEREPVWVRPRRTIQLGNRSVRPSEQTATELRHPAPR